MRASPPSPSRTKIVGDAVPSARQRRAVRPPLGGGCRRSRLGERKRVSSLPPSALRADTSLSEGGEGKRIPTPVTRSLARNDSASRCSGGQSRPPLRTLSLRGAKRRGNPFPFSEGRIPTPVTRSLARNDMGGAMWASSPTKMTTLSGGHFLLFCALVSEPARPRWGCWRPETRRCRCAWWWRRPC